MTNEAQTTEARRSRAAEGSEVGRAPAEERRRSMVSLHGLTQGGEVSLRNALAGIVLAGDDVEIERGGVRTAFAKGDLEVRQGGAGIVLTGGGVSIRQGGAQAIVSAGDVRLEQAGSGFAIARRITIGPKALTIFSVTPELQVQEGGRVVFGRGSSLAILGGVVGLIGLVAVLARRRVR